MKLTYDDYAKPTALVKYLTKMVSGDDFIVLDFFAGSGTTGQAILELNEEDHGTRKFILVQLPEICRDDSKVRAAGFDTISKFATERLRRFVAQKNKMDRTKGHLGFRKLDLDRSCFKQWQGSNDSGDDQSLLYNIVSHSDHIDPNATSDDLLCELLLKDGFPPTVQFERLSLAGKEVLSIAGGALLICLDKQLTQEVIDAIADRDPSRVICLDAGFQSNDQLKANAVQTFKARARNRETAIEFRTV